MKNTLFIGKGKQLSRIVVFHENIDAASYSKSSNNGKIKENETLHHIFIEVLESCVKREQSK